MEYIDRKAACPCGSGRKFRACCLKKIQEMPRVMGLPCFPEEFVVGRLLKKSVPFRKFHEIERPEIQRSLRWVEEPHLPAGITARHTSDENWNHVIRLRRIPPPSREAMVVAHELGHAIVEEMGYPVTGVRDAHYEFVSSPLNSLIHDPIVDGQILANYGLDLKEKFQEERAQDRQNLEGQQREPENFLAKAQWVLNHASALLDYEVAYGGQPIEDEEYFRWFQDRYPTVSREAADLTTLVKTIGYETPRQAETLLQAMISRFGFDAQMRVYRINVP